MTESQQTGPGTWHQRKERTNKQFYHLTFSLLKSSLPLFPGWPRCWEGGILCCEGGSLKWSDVLVLGTSLRSPNKPYSAVTAAGDNVQHGRAWPCGGSSSGIRSGPATSCSRKDGSLPMTFPSSSHSAPAPPQDCGLSIVTPAACLLGVSTRACRCLWVSSPQLEQALTRTPTLCCRWSRKPAQAKASTLSAPPSQEWTISSFPQQTSSSTTSGETSARCPKVLRNPLHGAASPRMGPAPFSISPIHPGLALDPIRKGQRNGPIPIP